MVPEVNVKAVGQTRGLSPRRPVRVHITTPTKESPAVCIETPRLLLRPLAEADRAEMVRRLEAGRDHLASLLPLNSEEDSADKVFSRQLELATQGDASGKSFRRIATNRAGEIVGAFGLVVIRRGLECNADLSFWLFPDYTGVGLAREGLLALMSYSLADLPEGLGMHRIDGWVRPDNVACQKVISACGFTKSGDESTHLATGESWQIHERWELTVLNWQREFG
ncbi:MAG TPA: N-acetyltransferase [Phycisphaerales bacterium]|nr:N-acetyltransferase [Phycisphaerales bacterium]